MDAERGKRIGSAIESLWGQLESIRSEASWERKLLAASYLHHRDNYPGTHVERRTTYDSSARNYLKVFHDGFIGYLMPQDDTWCELVSRNENAIGRESDKRWEYGELDALDGVEGLLRYSEYLTDALMAEYSEGAFYPDVSMVGWDWLIFGTGYMAAIDDAKAKRVEYRVFDPQEVCTAENGKGVVDVFVRKFVMDARDVLRAFPEAELELMRQEVKAGGGERAEHVLYEAVFPEGYLYSGGKRIEAGNGKRYSHVIWASDAGEVLANSGFDMFPIAVVRFEHDNSEVPYGTSLAERNLDDIIQLDDMCRIRQMMMQKNADPPMYIPYALQGRYSSRPGARNYGPDMSQKPSPIVDGFDYSKLLTDIQDRREMLRSNLGADLFRTVLGSTDSRKTAYEVSERKNEALTLLMMAIGSFKRELIEPMVRRTLSIMGAKGLVRGPEALYQREAMVRPAKAPAGIRDIDSFVDACRVELDSVFVQRTSAYLRYTGLTAGLSMLDAVSKLFPSARFQVDEKKYTRYLLYGTGVPKAIIREQKEAERAEQAYAEMVKQQMDAQLNEQNSQAVKNLSQAESAGIAGRQG